MIVMAVNFRVKPNQTDAAMAAMKVMAESTLKEDGCNQYRFHADFDDPNKIFLFEEWRDQGSLDLHFETEHMAIFKAALDNLLAESIKITRYVVSASGPL